MNIYKKKSDKKFVFNIIEACKHVYLFDHVSLYFLLEKNKLQET